MSGSVTGQPPSACRLGTPLAGRTIPGRWWRAAWRATVDLVLPPRCGFCGADIHTNDGEPLLCEVCLGVLGPETWLDCRRCGALVSAAPRKPSEAGSESALPRSRPACCPRCRAERYHFDAAVPLGVYRDELREAVLRMKQRTGDHLSIAMGDLYVRQRGEELSAFAPDVVVPIPMFWGRRVFRGTNSPEILSGRISHFLGVPVERAMLVRHRNTRPQAELSTTNRFENVRGAFWVRRGYAITGARVVVVDDVLTTGATCSEAANVLKKAGAECVVAAVVARTALEE
jgi:ComF family protein